MLRSLQKDLGLTCMFVGHGLGAVNYVSDRIAVMYLGKIVEIGPAQEVFHHPDVYKRQTVTPTANSGSMSIDISDIPNYKD